MAEQHSSEGASSSGASVSDTESTIEINIKTLDSQIYNFHVDKNMPVSSFKGKIANQIGVPVGHQRLIFRGKVLKDDHSLSDYHVENGDTLHLVERHPTQAQTSSGTGFADTTGNNGAEGNDGNAAAPRNRIGQISHSVVLGTFNVGDQGEGVASDLSRVIGAVLNSLGVGNQSIASAAMGAPNAATSNFSGLASQGNITEQGRGSTGGQSQAGNQIQFGQSFMSQQFHVPLTGASVPPPSPQMPIPDSLNTLSEFMTRMEEVLSQNGYQPSSSIPDTADQPATELPYNAQGSPTPEALSSVLRHAQRLLSGPAVAALSHIAGRLEQEAGSTDNSMRSQIQTESAQVGLAMQHLGALLLELGRTILLLRMGQSPAEAVVNAGPAVYISPSGPNPIMVQPFPHQTSPLFNAHAPAASAPSTGPLGQVGIIGSAPRNINIHIHAGTPLAPIVAAVGARTSGVEGSQGERSDGTAAGDSGATRVFPVRNVIAAAVPSRATTIAVSPVPTTSQLLSGGSNSQPPHAASVSAAISEVNSQIRNFLENARTEDQTPSGQQENQSAPDSSVEPGGDRADEIDPSCMQMEAIGDNSESHMGSMSELCPQEDLQERQGNNQNGASKSKDQSTCLVEPSPSHLSAELVENSGCNEEDVPLGLGGGLQPKRRSRETKLQPQSAMGEPPCSADQNQHPRTSSQQILQSLASRIPAAGTGSNGAAAGQIGQRTGAQDSYGQFNVTGMMSQLLHSPALNGLLSGVAQQTGVGSPDVLRNMVQQFTENPAMRNTVNQLAQQVDGEDFGHMIGGLETGHNGGLDFSRMLQQMMPVVSQVLGGGSVHNEEVRSMVPELLTQHDDRRSSREDSSFGGCSQIDTQEVLQRIALQSSSQDIFRAVAQNAAECSGTGEEGFVDAICGNENLANEFVEILRHDLHRQLQGGSASDGKS